MLPFRKPFLLTALPTYLSHSVVFSLETWSGSVLTEACIESGWRGVASSVSSRIAPWRVKSCLALFRTRSKQRGGEKEHPPNRGHQTSVKEGGVAATDLLRIVSHISTAITTSRNATTRLITSMSWYSLDRWA